MRIGYRSDLADLGNLLFFSPCEVGFLIDESVELVHNWRLGLKCNLLNVQYFRPPHDSRMIIDITVTRTTGTDNRENLSHVTLIL